MYLDTTRLPELFRSCTCTNVTPLRLRTLPSRCEVHKHLKYMEGIYFVAGEQVR